MPERSTPFGGRTWLTLVLVGAFAWSLAGVDWSGRLLHPGGRAAIGQLLRALVQPDLSPGILALAVKATWRTVAYATAGTTLAVALAVPLGLLASGALFRHPVLRGATVATFRGLLGFMRAIHELVWAWLFVAAIGLTPFAAVLALALPYAGILGRILADLFNDVPEAPLQALRATGAGEAQVLLYGRLPTALANMVSYALYRFECAIRSAAIMSFVGLGGLGYQVQVALDDLRYDEVWTFVFFLVALVVLVDAAGTAARRRMVA